MRRWGEFFEIFRKNRSATLGQMTRPRNSQQQKKRTLRPGRPQSKIESETRDKYLDLAWELKKNPEHAGDGDASCNMCTRYGHQIVIKDLEDLEIRR